MAENKRTEFQIMYDRVLISEMYRKGAYQETIRDAINARYKSDKLEVTLTRQQIGYDIKELIKEWRESAVLNIDEIKQAELEKINIIEAEMWEAWFRSKTTKEIEREKEGFNSKGEFLETVVTRSYPIGETKYIDTIKWCVEMRLKLFGIMDAESIEIPGDTTKAPAKLRIVKLPDNGRISY